MAIFSYGIYIWAYPVQQCVRMLMGLGVPWYWNALASFPVVLCLAALSWRWVEAPCLGFKTWPRSRGTGALALTTSPAVHNTAPDPGPRN